jgi:hypothetical protein
MWNNWFGDVNGFEKVKKARLITEWLWSYLFEPVLQHVTDAADIVTSNTMKQSGSKEQENKEEENNKYGSSLCWHVAKVLVNSCQTTWCHMQGTSDLHYELKLLSKLKAVGHFKGFVTCVNKP